MVKREGSDLDEAKLKAFALANAPAYQHPRSIWFVDSLPLASTNKLDRKAMHDMAAERLRHRDTGLEELERMDETFRGFLDRLRQAGELIDFRQPIDIRHIATLVDQSDKAIFFHKVIGYDIPVVSGIIRTRERAMMAMGASEYLEIEERLKNGIAKPIPPQRIATSPAREVVMKGDDVDLYKLPIPMSSIYDGGPMITAGVVIAKDPEFGINTGIYRFMVKEKNLTGIDIVTPNNMRLFVQRAYEAKRPLPISISIGTHPIELLGAGFKAPLGTDEMAIAGGIRGQAVKLAAGDTVDVPYIADAEIVLEGEVLPTGWTHPEGSLRRIHLADGRTALESDRPHHVGVDAPRRDLLRAAYALGKHLADGADALCRDSSGVAYRERRRQGHQHDDGRRHLLARGDFDQEAGWRRQERTCLPRSRSWISSMSSWSTTTSTCSIRSRSNGRSQPACRATAIF